jgi:hypothetical protein
MTAFVVVWVVVGKLGLAVAPRGMKQSMNLLFFFYHVNPSMSEPVADKYIFSPPFCYFFIDEIGRNFEPVSRSTRIRRCSDCDCSR